MRGEAQDPAGQRRSARLTHLQGLVDQGGGRVRLGEAASRLGVSAMTLRRDLAAPGSALVLVGGHVMPFSPADFSRGYSLARDVASHAAGKRQAARHAAGLVRDGDTLFIDCGTTMPHLVEALPAGAALTVICYALNIANLLCRRPETRVVLLGGLFHPSSATFASEESLATLARLRINTAFLSAGGFHAAGGATCSNFNEVPVKQAALAHAEAAILVIDASKIGRLTSAHFAAADRFDRVVTDAAAKPELLAPFGDPGRFAVAPPGARAGRRHGRDPQGGAS